MAQIQPVCVPGWGKKHSAGITVDDGIELNPASATGTQIRKNAGYGGVRIDSRATLAGARIAFQIDIGFGDAGTADAQAVQYPTLIADVPALTLRAYPEAIVLAEKTHAPVCAWHGQQPHEGLL